VLKWIVGVVTLLVLAPLGTFAFEAFYAQRADYLWSPNIAEPAFVDRHPVVSFDSAHHNASAISFAGRYWQFGNLLRADGYAVVDGNEKFTAKSLQGADVLVIANAAGSAKFQVFGINLPFVEEGDRAAPAFTADEIDAVRAWVERGGALLLIADHAPFGAAAEAMGAAFGVKMNKGYVDVPGENPDPLLFSRTNDRLGNHPILNGSTGTDRVSTVMTYTGQSLDGPPDASILLRLPPNAIENVPDNRGEWTEFKAGAAQGLAFEFGKGRVVVLGEAAVATAQVDNLKPFGMNVPGNDNKQFVRNIMRWLARDL
jgi:hypothetical protein